MDSIAYFRAMARNNAWANHRLLTACAKLSDAEFQAERVSFFPSIMATLNHNLYVDWFYVDALEGGTLGPKAWAKTTTPCPTMATLMPETTRDRQAAGRILRRAGRCRAPA